MSAQVDLPPSPITSTIRFDAGGVNHGHLQLPYSRDDSAYGAVMIPISVITNGDGPTVLLSGGNHGDEYQGPLALTRLINTIDAEQVTGRLIVVPYMNQPAFAGATRTSPIDGVNLNRAFPGSPTGTVTQKIADYFARTLLPMADMVQDVHDGGKTLEFIPMAAAHKIEDKELEARNLAAATAFNAPFVSLLLEIDMLGMWDSLVESSGTPFITTEIGGGGTTRRDWTEITSRGLHNVLQHWGALRGSAEPSTSQVLSFPDEDAYLTSQGNGLIEWLVALGDPIRAGQPLARVYDTVHVGNKPTDYLATVDGVLAMRHYPGLVKLGDAIALQGQLG